MWKEQRESSMKSRILFLSIFDKVFTNSSDRERFEKLDLQMEKIRIQNTISKMISSPKLRPLLVGM